MTKDKCRIAQEQECQVVTKPECNDVSENVCTDEIVTRVENQCNTVQKQKVTYTFRSKFEILNYNLLVH